MSKRNKPKDDLRQYRAVPIQSARAEGAGENGKRGILATESPVPMPDWERMEMVPEVLCIDGCKTRGTDLKLVDSHGVGSVRNVLGSFRDIQRRDANDSTPFPYMDGTPDISKAEPDIRTKYDEGHINEMSVGYEFNPARSKYVPEGETFEHNGRTFTGPVNVRMEWTATEASLVTLGADEQAQIRGFQSIEDAFGEKKNVDTVANLIEIEPTIRSTNQKDSMSKETETQPTPAPAAPAPAVPAGEGIRSNAEPDNRAERERASVIADLGSKFSCNDAARDAIANGVSVAQFCRDMDGNQAPAEPVQADPIPWEQKEAKEYNLGRALRKIAAGEHLDGLEREVSDHVGERSGKGSTRGFYLPSAQDLSQFGARGERTTLTAGTAATLGNVVSTSLGAQEYMPYFRPTPIMWELGAQVITGVTGNFDIATGLTAAVASTKAESTAHSESNPTSKKISYAPRAYGFYTTVSKRLLRQSDIAVDSYVRQEMTDAITIAFDADGLNGGGAGSDECDGIIGHTDAGTVTIGSAAAPTFTELLEFEQDVETANALGNNLAYVTTPAIKNWCKKTAEYGTDRDPIWTPSSGGLASEGTINGYRAVSTNQCPADRIVFGDFSKYIYVIFDGVEITLTEDATLAKQRDVQFTCNMDIDGQAKYGEAFSTDA